MRSIGIRKGYLALKNLLRCICRKAVAGKEKVHFPCALTKRFRQQHSLHFKFITLSAFSKFFQKIDAFSNKHPILIQIIILLIAYGGSIMIQSRFSSEDADKLEKLILKGFFIAPLLTLMVSNQKAIVNHFSAVFFYDKSNRQIDENIDTDNIAYKYDMTIREIMIEVIYSLSPNQKIKDYIEFTKEIIKNSLAAREGNAYKNTTALIFSGSALMIGFFMLLFGFHTGALTLLLYSLLIILTKEVLGIRSIIKRALFARFLIRLSKEKDKLSESDRRDIVLGNSDQRTI